MELIRRLEATARDRLDPAVHAYFAGGAGDEQTLAENDRAWRRWWLRPRTMVDVSAIDMAVDLLGRRHTAPIVIAPMAAQRLLHPDGELAAAQAAAAAGLVYTLSTRATADVGEVCRAAGDGGVWFQLYVQRDRAATEEALRHAVRSGVEALVLTVDLPVGGRRERERAFPDIELPEGVTLATHTGRPAESTIKPLGGWDPALTWPDVGWLRDVTDGLPVLVKGILTAEDAEAAVEAGVAGVIVSNHGARQLDGVVPTAMALEEVAGAVEGRVPILVDGGIRDGGDVVRALALGADAVLIGRPVAWALAAGGQEGVENLLRALTEDVERALALTGCPDARAVPRERVRMGIV
ncbi:MAG: alpha-hydroxy-acid oxidizing protein [Solirubrobacteraceae bacterium]|nr:alpha-hydroxy-acid oxidizing protein [Solirubrobacteraceae bacterium]